MLAASQVGRSSAPPCSNTGGKSFPSPLVSVDWLSFSWEVEKLSHQGICDLLSGWFDRPVALNFTGRGFMGFTIRADIVVAIEGETISVGLMAWGGKTQNGRGLVSIPGKGCALIRPELLEVVRGDLERLEARITRVDLAADDMAGNFSVDVAAEWYRSGEFNAGGRQPSHETAGTWLTPDGAGRTLYVGKAKNGKGLCVYEKGKQLGDVASPWVRWELRLLNRDRVIPHDVLTRSAEYFAGGFPCLGRIVAAAAEKVRTVRVSVEKSLAKLVTYARASYGRLVHVLLRHHGGDYAAVVEVLRLRGVPATLSQVWAAASEPRPSGSALG